MMIMMMMMKHDFENAKPKGTRVCCSFKSLYEFFLHLDNVELIF